MSRSVQLGITLALVVLIHSKKLSGGDLPPLPIHQPRPLPRAIWGHWSSYGPCSRTCGRGVKMRTRNCLQWAGDRYTETHLTACDGSNIDYKICELGKCSRLDEDFRAYQCRILSKTRPISGNIYVWKPLHEGTMCELHCKAVGQPFFYSFGTVQDGTPCHTTDNHVCVHGKCMMIGCDGHVGIGTRMDMCGVCNGRNETCSHVRSTYRTQLPTGQTRHRGYNEVVTIPRGSTRFRVKEASRNTLALMDSRNRFVLNGHYTKDKPGVYRIGGTMVTYDRVGDGYEAIQGDGPTREDIHVMLLYRQQNTGVNYEFWIKGKPSTDLLNQSYAGFDNAIPVDVTDQPTRGTSQVTVSPAVRKTTLSDDQIWDMVMKEIEDERKGVTKYRKDRQHIPRKKKETLDRSRNRTKNKVKKVAVRKDRLRRKKKKKKIKKGRRFLSKSQCGPCPKIKDRNKQFCKSDFVSKVRVNGVEVFGNNTRYDMTILYTYRNIVPLLHREYLWVNNICKCPRLRLRKEYIIMGMMGYHGKREIRLSVSPSNYVRPFSYKHDLRMQKLKRKRSRCKVKKKVF